jgi:hypothetical protein
VRASPGEGVIWAVRDPVEKTAGGVWRGAIPTQVIDEGVLDKRLLVRESSSPSAAGQPARRQHLSPVAAR